MSFVCLFVWLFELYVAFNISNPILTLNVYSKGPNDNIHHDQILGHASHYTVAMAVGTGRGGTGIKPRAVAWQSITLPLRHAKSLKNNDI